MSELVFGQSGSGKPAVQNAGTLRQTPTGYFAQFSVGGGRRKGVLLTTCADDESAERRRLAIARMVNSLREGGYAATIPNVIRDAGAATEDELRKIERLVARIVSGKEPGLSKLHGVRRDGITFLDLADLWTSGELAAQYPDHVKTKTTSGEDKRILGWLGKIRMPDGAKFGDRVVATVTLDDLDHVMAALPKSAEAPATRRHYAQSLRKLLSYAVYPLRLMPTLPIPKGWLPKGSTDKAKAWLYPSEDLALMQCRGVPLVHRLLFGVLVREGLRVSEALALTWSELDLARGVIRLDKNKTDDPRTWVLGADVRLALKAWKDLRGRKAKKVPAVFPAALLGSRFNMAKRLRAQLQLAGVTRKELIDPIPGRVRLRVHDLRGTFVTMALGTGRTEAWVTDRTGHRSSQMLYLYKRASRTAAELGLAWFTPLDRAIPEFAPKAGQGANGVQTGGSSGRQPPSPRARTSQNRPFAPARALRPSPLNPLADSSSLSWPTSKTASFSADSRTTRRSRRFHRLRSLHLFDLSWFTGGSRRTFVWASSRVLRPARVEQRAERKSPAGQWRRRRPGSPPNDPHRQTRAPRTRRRRSSRALGARGLHDLGGARHQLRRWSLRGETPRRRELRHDDRGGVRWRSARRNASICAARSTDPRRMCRGRGFPPASSMSSPVAARRANTSFGGRRSTR